MNTTIQTALNSPRFSSLYPDHSSVAHYGHWLVAVESRESVDAHNNAIELLTDANPGWDEFEVLTVDDGEVIVFCPVNEYMLRAAGEAIESNAHEE